MFFWNSLFLFCDPVDVGSLISGSSAFSKSSLNIWKFRIHVLLKPCLENFEHYFASLWDEWSCAVVWTFFGIVFLWDWNENCLICMLLALYMSQICSVFGRIYTKLLIIVNQLELDFSFHVCIRVLRENRWYFQIRIIKTVNKETVYKHVNEVLENHKN